MPKEITFYFFFLLSECIFVIKMNMQRKNIKIDNNNILEDSSLFVYLFIGYINYNGLL